MGMNKPQGEEFKLLETHGQVKNGWEKKTEHLSNGKRPEDRSFVTTHPGHNGLMVHVCGVIQKMLKYLGYVQSKSCISNSMQTVLRLQNLHFIVSMAFFVVCFTSPWYMMQYLKKKLYFELNSFGFTSSCKNSTGFLAPLMITLYLNRI